MRLFLTLLMIASAATAAAENSDPVPVTTKTTDGVTVYGYQYFGGLPDDAPLLLVFHQGLSNARGEYAGLAEWLNSEGFRVLAWDQRNGGDLYGSENQTLRDLPEGTPNGYCDTYKDVEAALQYTKSNRLADSVIAWGSSYSGALVFQLATNHEDFVRGVIAFSPSTGGSVVECRARLWVDAIDVPKVVFRPESEMARESSVEQRDIVTAAGGEYHVIEGGVHGSSALVDERTEQDMQSARQAVLQWLRGVD